jgi:hypothetical protein
MIVKHSNFSSIATCLYQKPSWNVITDRRRKKIILLFCVSHKIFGSNRRKLFIDAVVHHLYQLGSVPVDDQLKTILAELK